MSTWTDMQWQFNLNINSNVYTCVQQLCMMYELICIKWVLDIYSTREIMDVSSLLKKKKYITFNFFAEIS